MNSEHAIAIIDDSSSVRRALESLLRSLGFVVLSFESAEAFLTSPVVRETSCVVTDVEMPGLTGIDLYERMRSDKNQTPVIFITANSEEKVRARLGSMPCVLNKPFEVDELAACINQSIAAP
ncbi:response regulator [Tardiphaga sp. 37S4]|uniref:response regulator transcription factor n=1 Tax=Tardiphaga sp. 37S4 TaxID=1404741 RepID=UPI001E290592|nr:response regulator [Tardiphaga sp. 37S4]UFS74954.1 response regulator [Tardiphaga sp. 37S4]